MPIPGVVTKDAVGLGDDMPTLYVGEGGVLHTARPDVFGIELSFEVLHLSFGERITWSSRLSRVWDYRAERPGSLRPA